MKLKHQMKLLKDAQLAVICSLDINVMKLKHSDREVISWLGW